MWSQFKENSSSSSFQQRVREVVKFLASLVEASGPKGAFLREWVQNDCDQKTGCILGANCTQNLVKNKHL